MWRKVVIEILGGAAIYAAQGIYRLIRRAINRKQQRRDLEPSCEERTEAGQLIDDCDKRHLHSEQ